MVASSKFVPPAFVNLLKMSLLRLVAAGMLPKNLVTTEFWVLLKTKFANAGAHARRQARKVRLL